MAQRLRLMAEHFQDWPLWTDAGATLREDWSCLPETLLDELAGWVSHWNKHFDWQAGWAEGQGPWHVAEGQRLRDRLSAELGDEWEVELLAD